jgi:hypothetical protein
MSAGEFTAKTVRHAFFEREQERCFRCRRPLLFEDRGIGWSAHHRLPRQMGGVGRNSLAAAIVSAITNCLILCGSGTTGCHGWAEKYRAIAEDYGYIVRRGINPPAGVRIKKLDGTWWLLTSSGLAVECEGRAGE